MSNPQLKNSFSWGDALFLYVERPGQPLSIAGVSVFEGKVPLKECRELVESKLPLIPRYRQRVAFPPLNLGLPHWEFDPNFDLRNHIRQVTLRNGTEADLKTLVSSIVSTHLDRQRPLWDITLVQGLEGNRTGMLARIHHCLADGISGLGIMNLLMDTSPVARRPPRVKQATPTTPAPRDAGTALFEAFLKSSFAAVNGVLKLQTEAMQMAQGLMANSGESLSELLNVLPELAAPADRLPFNVICQGPQKFGWTEIDLAAVKEVKNRCGGTVNDVILTVVASALRRYAEQCKVNAQGRSARIVIPVNVRGGDSATELGNRISFVPVTVPLDIRNPQKLFAHVRQRTEYLKRVHAAELVGFAGGLFSAIPSPILAAIGPVASQLPLSLCNMICTNIAGPQVPLYLLGHKMLSWYPYVPIGGEMGTNWAILSYNGKAYFGFTCDVGGVPDPENLEKFVTGSFAELCRSAQHVKPKAKPEAQAQSAAQRDAAGRSKRERSRTIPLGAPVAEKAKPQPGRGKKVKPHSNGAGRHTKRSKWNSKAALALAQAPKRPETILEVLAPVTAAEGVLQAAGD